jgi:Cys-tRNA(Pro)/Cys-tRNA(Cys) deacylase
MERKLMTQKTQAMRVLEGQGVHYSSMTYDKNERDAMAIAAEVGVPPGQVFKTLVVVRQSKKPLLVMVPANRQLSLKKLAAQIGEKKVKMASQAEAERLTGLQVGGISPLVLLNKGFQILLDRSAQDQEEIVLSAGQRGIQLRIRVNDLVQVTRPQVLDIAD